MNETYMLGIDPGVHTGMAFVHPGGQLLAKTTALGIHEVYNFIFDNIVNASLDGDAQAVIESFAGAGALRRETIITLETLGFAHGVLYTQDIPIIFQPPQRRLAYEGRAKIVLPTHDDRHMRSAYAHALCALDNLNV